MVRVSTVGCNERTTPIADAHQDRKCFIVKAEELVTAFLKLESASTLAANFLDKLA